MNRVILAAYYLLYKDLIRLYAVYNEAMINIIGALVLVVVVFSV